MTVQHNQGFPKPAVQEHTGGRVSQ